MDQLAVLSLPSVPLWGQALVVYLTGLLIIAAVWRVETARIGTPVPITTIFLVFQHHAFALGGLLLAVTAGDATIPTLVGQFPVTVGMARLLLVELLSLAFALAGLLAIVWFKPPSTYRHVRSTASGLHRGQAHWHSSLATLLPVATVISILVAWYSNSHFSNQWVAFALQTTTAILPGGFFIAGAWWHRLSWQHKVIVLGAYGLLCLLNLTQGGRGLWFYAGGLLGLGYLFSRKRTWRDTARLLLIGAVAAAVLIVGAARLTPIRTDFLGTSPSTGVYARILRIPDTLALLWSGYGQLGGIQDEVRTFAERSVEQTVRVVMGYDSPPVGWSGQSWRDLLAGFVPQMLFPQQSITETAPYFLADYGYAVIPGENVGLGFALFADAWRRGRLVGVAAVYLALGGVLGLLSRYCAAYREEWRRMVFGAFIAFAAADSYVFTVMTFWSAVLNALVVTVLWLWLLRLVLDPERARRARFAEPPNRMGQWHEVVPSAEDKRSL